MLLSLLWELDLGAHLRAFTTVLSDKLLEGNSHLILQLTLLIRSSFTSHSLPPLLAAVHLFLIDTDAFLPKTQSMLRCSLCGKLWETKTAILDHYKTAVFTILPFPSLRPHGNDYRVFLKHVVFIHWVLQGKGFGHILKLAEGQYLIQRQARQLPWIDFLHWNWTCSKYFIAVRRKNENLSRSFQSLDPTIRILPRKLCFHRTNILQ